MPVTFHGNTTFIEVNGTFTENTNKTIVRHINTGNFDNVHISTQTECTQEIIMTDSNIPRGAEQPIPADGEDIDDTDEMQDQEPVSLMDLANSANFDPAKVFAMMQAGKVVLPKKGLPPSASRQQIKENGESDNRRTNRNNEDDEGPGRSGGRANSSRVHDEDGDDDNLSDVEELNSSDMPSGSGSSEPPRHPQDVEFINMIQKAGREGFDKSPAGAKRFIQNTKDVVLAAHKAGSGSHLPMYYSQTIQRTKQVNGQHVYPEGNYTKVNGTYNLHREVTQEINENSWNVRNATFTETEVNVRKFKMAGKKD